MRRLGQTWAPPGKLIYKAPVVDTVGQSRLLFHGNLSSMLPRRPTAFDPDFAVNFSHGEPAAAGQDANSPKSQNTDETAAQPVADIDHHCQICPTCGHLLTGHHCKLVCTQCGYYLSCADYY